MRTNERGNPPLLDGFTYVELIGQGGFADVFLYEQARPTRRVAVKVLLASAVDSQAREQFDVEANVMAQLSGHPAIVPIFETGVSRDDRPYLVMEYCPPPSLAGRFRAERFEVPEALETMIKIASAVETAHRAGILHRDVKPHNILCNSFGTPLLTDFGIAGTTNDDAAEAYGLSVPWSPPEAFGDAMPVDPRSDVYSLGATLYSLLAGRSPFEVVGAANDNATLMSRIERQALPRIGRPDVPDALQDVLVRSMSKDVSGRHPTAMAFARALQDVQSQLHLAQTKIDVLDASPTAVPAQDSEHRTQVRPIQIIVPDSEAGTRLRPVVVPQVPSAPSGRVDDRTARKLPGSARAEAVPDTMARGGPAVADRTDGSHFLAGPEREVPRVDDAIGPSRLPVAWWAGLALAAVVVGVIAVALLGGGSEEEPDDVVAAAPSAAAPDANDVIGSTAPAPTVTASAADGEVVFRWRVPEGETVDGFRVRTGDGPDDLGTPQDLDETSLSVDAGAGDLVCASVTSVVDDTESTPSTECKEAP